MKWIWFWFLNKKRKRNNKFSVLKLSQKKLTPKNKFSAKELQNWISRICGCQISAWLFLRPNPLRFRSNPRQTVTQKICSRILKTFDLIGRLDMKNLFHYMFLSIAPKPSRRIVGHGHKMCSRPVHLGEGISSFGYTNSFVFVNH